MAEINCPICGLYTVTDIMVPDKDGYIFIGCHNNRAHMGVEIITDAISMPSEGTSIEPEISDD